MTVMTCTFLFWHQVSITDLYIILPFVVFYTVYYFPLDFNGFETLSGPYLRTTWSISMKFTHITSGLCGAYIPIYKLF